MTVKNIFEPEVKNDIVERINKLNAQSKPLWGKMTSGQMLAHCQIPIGVGLGTHTIRRTFLSYALGPLVKPILYNEKPFKRNLPTDKSFIMRDEKDFEKEKAVLLDMINRFKEENLSGKPHPFFGKIEPSHWGTGTWKHLDHHLQQFGV